MALNRFTRVSAAALALGAGLVFLAPSTAGQSATPAAPDTATIVHVLNRLGFGPRPGDVERVRAMGLTAYIDQQLHPERIPDSGLDARLASFTTLTMPTRALATNYFIPAQQARRDADLKQQRATAKAAQAGSAGSDDAMMAPESAAAAPTSPQALLASLPPEARDAIAGQRAVMNELMQAKMLRAALSERQLQEVMADFWLNHFNVFIGKGEVRQYLTEYERNVIRPNTLGRFRDLLGAVAHSPAMLFYLDNWQSSTPNAPQIPPQALRRRLQNSRLTPEQQARVANRVAPPNGQRPARGINENYAREIMELHTLGVDGGYTQTDVVELARILTGWTIDLPRQGGSFMFRPMMHDTGTKHFLGETFKADGENEGERALDLLARHPATARHLAYQLSQRFVSDEPPAALVARAAETFTRTDGDIREVVRTIVTSPEFLAAEARRAKVKTPFEFVVSAVRATGATIQVAQPLVAAMQNLGMPLYGCQPPTGYAMTADAWVNTGALLNRMNFAVQLVSGGRIQPQQAPGRGGPPPAPNGGPGRGRGPGAAARGPIQVDVKGLAPDTSAASQEAIVTALLNGKASAATTQTLARAQTPTELIALALGAPEFQRR